MQLKDALQAAVLQLEESGIGSSRRNAELLMMFVLGCDRAYIYAHPERELASGEHGRYEAVIVERSRGVPAQYITGHQEFWGLDFLVSPAVLIPGLRPSTSSKRFWNCGEPTEFPAAGVPGCWMWEPVPDALPWPSLMNCRRPRFMPLTFPPKRCR